MQRYKSWKDVLASARLSVINSVCAGQAQSPTQLLALTLAKMPCSLLTACCNVLRSSSATPESKQQVVKGLFVGVF